MPPRPTRAPAAAIGLEASERDLAGGAEDADAEAAARRRAETQLVEEAELHARVGEHHLDVAARDVLEQLHVDVVVLDGGREHGAPAPDDLLGLAPRQLLLLHHLAHAQRRTASA